MDDTKNLTLLTLYETHKKEITTRRLFEFITGTTSLLFYGFIFLFILIRRGAHGLSLSMGMKGIITIALIIVGDIIVYFLVKNYRRRSALKRAVCRIDEALGLFKEGEFLPGQSVYPAEWKKYGEENFGRNMSRLFAIMAIAALTIVVLWLN